MAGYAKQRTNWLDFPVTSTPITAANLNGLETAIFDLKYLTYNVKDYGGSSGASASTNNAAIASAVSDASAAGGGIVLFTERFDISSAISVPNFVNFKGTGQSAGLRATGNHYCFNLNPANRTSFAGFTVEATSTQSSGGGFDFTNAGDNIWLEDIYLGNNLFIGLNIAPTSGTHGLVWADRLRWNGVTGSNTGIVVGDGTSICPNVFISNTIGTAASITDMDTWVKILKNADSVQMADSLFYSGSKGLVAGASGTGDVTNCKFSNVVFDNQNLEGVNVTSCRLMNFSNCSVQGCGTTALSGIKVGASAKGFNWSGGNIHECRFHGISIVNGALDTTISGASIMNNNTTNQTFGSGVSVEAGASDWSITNSEIGNNLPVTANQKYGILVADGASNRVVTTGNRFPSNVTGAYLNSGVTGASVEWSRNVPEVINSVNSATTTTLPPGEFVIVALTVSPVTSITAGHVGRVVTLQFTGIVTLTDGSNLKLNGNFVTTADDTITLRSDGTNWFEVSRSVN